VGASSFCITSVWDFSGDHFEARKVFSDWRRNALMPKFKVMLERVDTITRQAVIVVEAANAEEARSRILANLQFDEAAYDDNLVEVDSGFGRMTVEVRVNGSEPAQIPRATAALSALDHK
jgi:hypothetical protein